MLSNSTIKLLRLPFAFFLTPLYFFALSEVKTVNWPDAVMVFIVLHLLIYPASNAYNSFMDRDTESIGGLENPPPPSPQLYHVSIILDLAAVVIGFIIDPLFGAMLPLYIGASKAYSYRRIRLKRYPVIGYLTVVIFQGAFTFWLVYYGASGNKSLGIIPWQGMLIAAFLIGGFYPLTQIYQHRQDVADGVHTISYRLGYMGTFAFCALMYVIAWGLMAQFFIQKQRVAQFAAICILFIPVIYFFIRWWLKVGQDNTAANFRNTMRMNWIAAICTNIAFIILLSWRWFE